MKILSTIGVFVLLATLASCDSKPEATTSAPTTTAPEAGIAKATPSESAAYAVKVEAPDVHVGEEGKLQVRITPGTGFKINKEYPWKIKVDGTELVSVSNTEFDKTKFTLSDSVAEFSVDCQAEAAGDHKLSATANFSVCNDNVCKNFRDEPIEIAFQAIP